MLSYIRQTPVVEEREVEAEAEAEAEEEEGRSGDGLLSFLLSSKKTEPGSFFFPCFLACLIFLSFLFALILSFFSFLSYFLHLPTLDELTENKEEGEGNEGTGEGDFLSFLLSSKKTDTGLPPFLSLCFFPPFFPFPSLFSHITKDDASSNYGEEGGTEHADVHQHDDDGFLFFPFLSFPLLSFPFFSFPSLFSSSGFLSVTFLAFPFF